MKIETRRIYEEPPTGRIQWTRDERGAWWRRIIGANSRQYKGWAPDTVGPTRTDLRLVGLKTTRLPIDKLGSED